MVDVPREKPTNSESPSSNESIISREKLAGLAAKLESRSLTEAEEDLLDELKGKKHSLGDRGKHWETIGPLHEAKEKLDALKSDPDIRDLLGNDQGVIDRLIPKFLSPSHLRFDDLMAIVSIKHPSRKHARTGVSSRDTAGQRIVGLIDSVRNEMKKPEVVAALGADKAIRQLYAEIDGAVYDAEVRAAKALMASDPSIDRSAADSVATRDAKNANAFAKAVEDHRCDAKLIQLTNNYAKAC